MYRSALAALAILAGFFCCPVSADLLPDASVADQSKFQVAYLKAPAKVRAIDVRLRIHGLPGDLSGNYEPLDPGGPLITLETESLNVWWHELGHHAHYWCLNAEEWAEWKVFCGKPGDFAAAEVFADAFRTAYKSGQTAGRLVVKVRSYFD